MAAMKRLGITKIANPNKQGGTGFPPRRSPQAIRLMIKIKGN
jgi:hypothetical protein